tara:strand:- start:425 stop:901 length:477 start_codon:yes stop_codon:yes gene_type:complete
MTKLLEDYDNNVIDEETNNICNSIDTVKNITRREYVIDLLGYTLLKNKQYKLDIIQNNNIINTITLNMDYYYNKNIKSYYLKYEAPFYLDSEIGYLEFIVKNKYNVIQKINFKYKLNNPIFNTDIIKIAGENYEFYIYMKRLNKNNHFYIYKFIFNFI